MASPAQVTVAVVVCTYSEARWAQLVRCIGSVLTQSVAPQEIILVVDHNDALIVAARAEFPAVSVIANAEAKGLSGARNTGAAAATSELIVFLDDDAWAAPDWLLRLVDAFRSVDVIGAGGSATPAWVTGAPSWFPAEFLWVVGCSYRGLPERRAAVRNPLGCNMAFRRSAFERTGGFRSDFGRVGSRPIGVEETEFSIRARAAMAGSEVLYVPDAVVHHEVPEQRATWSYFAARCYGEGLSKAHLRRVAGARDSLSSERRYLASVIPSGVLRDLAALRVRRALASVGGVAITAFGFLVGSATRRSLDS